MINVHIILDTDGFPVGHGNICMHSDGVSVINFRYLKIENQLEKSLLLVVSFLQ